jgi:hypothetical protein
VPPAPAARACSVLAGAVVAVWCAALAVRAVRDLPERAAAAARAVNDSAAVRIQRASGLSPALTAALGAALPRDGRLVLYSPYGGAAFELDAADVRGEPARQVRLLFERAKNLLYPEPRDVHFARDAAELLPHVEPVFVGRLVVLDGTLDDAPLAVGGGAFDLLHTTGAGEPRLRVWRLREVRR